MNPVVLTDDEREMVLRAAKELVHVNPYEDFETFLVSVYQVVATLPQRVVRQLIDYVTDPRAYGALTLVNLPIDEPLAPTPIDSRRNPDKDTFISEACLLAVCLVLGQPLGYRDEKDAEIIQAVAPVRAESLSTSSESSDSALPFHTDFSFDKWHPERPFNVHNADYIVLFCLRGDRHEEALTYYADARDICRRLDQADIKIMREKRYQFAASYSFTGTCGSERIWSVPSPLLSGPDAFPEISVDMLCGVRAMDDEAATALEALRTTCNEPGVASAVCLRPGDVLIIDNRKGAHARSAFRADFDGQDRWLHRVYVRRSLAELRDEANGARRVF